MGKESNFKTAIENNVLNTAAKEIANLNVYVCEHVHIWKIVNFLTIILE